MTDKQHNVPPENPDKAAALIERIFSPTLPRVDHDTLRRMEAEHAASLGRKEGGRGWHLNAVSIKGFTFKGTLSAAYFGGVGFTDCTFDGTALDDAVFADAIFSNCTFRNVDAPSALIHDCMFIGCTGEGINVRGAAIMKCDVDGSTFKDIDLRGATIIKCEAEESTAECLNLKNATCYDLTPR